MKKIERFDKYMEVKGLNDNKVTNDLSLSVGLLGKSRKENRDLSDRVVEQILNFYTDLNKVWLLTGEGEMLKDTTELPEELKSDSALVLDKDFRLVPIIHIDSVGGIHSSNDIVDETEYVEGHVPFVGAREDDRAIYQSGESMIPTIPPGSLMQIREVVGWREFFGYGDIFVLLLTDGRRITKEVTRYDANPKEYVWCVSHNPNVPDEELPRSMIVRVWKVIKVLTDKGW